MFVFVIVDVQQPVGKWKLGRNPSKKLDDRLVAVIAEPMSKKDNLLVASPTDVEQGQSIVGIAHGVPKSGDGSLLAALSNVREWVVAFIHTDRRPAVELKHLKPRLGSG